MFERLSSQLGQSIIVENRAGAGGTLGAAALVKSSPDGYTMLVNSSAHAISPSLYPNLTYHPARDFAAVIPLGISANVLVVSAALMCPPLNETADRVLGSYAAKACDYRF